jgi:hypothetical protein
VTRATKAFLINNVLRPIGQPIYWLARGISWLLFASLNKRMGRKGQKRLAQDVEAALPFLFSQYHARFVPNEGVRFPEPFDYATVTMALDDLLLRVVRGRGELHVNIAPARSPDDWHEVRVVLSILDGKDDMRYASFGNLRRASYALEPNMQRLKSFFAPAGYATKQRELAEVYKRDRAVMREWEAEMNAKLKEL